MRQILLLERGKGLEEFGELLNIGQTWIDLRLKKERGIADHLCAALLELPDHVCVNFTRPGPASDIGNALIVDGYHRDTRRRDVTGCSNTPVISQALEALDKITARCKKQHHGNDESEEPVGFPESRFLHATHPDWMPEAFDFLLLKAFELEILRYFGQKYMIICETGCSMGIREDRNSGFANPPSASSRLNFATCLTGRAPENAVRLRSGAVGFSKGRVSGGVQRPVDGKQNGFSGAALQVMALRH